MQASDADDPLGSIGLVSLNTSAYNRAIQALAVLLVDAVDSGASVNFLSGLTEAEAAAWWQARTELVVDGTMTVLVARDIVSAGEVDSMGGRIIGSALVVRSRNSNSPHRAEVQKVLVHSSRRRHGLGRALMLAVEAMARADGRWLLVLDTQAEPFYRSLGWQELGTMPNHSLRADGTLAPTVFFWKDLRTSG